MKALGGLIKLYIKLFSEMYISLSNGAFMTENALKLVFSTVGKIDFTVKNSSSSKLKFLYAK